MLPAADSYETLAAAFAWKVPAHYNIGVDACYKWADGSGRLALIYETREGSETRFTFDDLKTLSNQFANALARAGLERGDRVGIFLPQSPETAIAHMAIYKAGYIAVPLFQLFGVDAIQYRLADSGAAALITDHTGFEKLQQVRETLPDLNATYCVDSVSRDDAHSFWDSLRAEPDVFTPSYNDTDAT